MAKYQKKKIQDTENGGFGKYKEGVGGGASPQPGDPSKHGHGVNSDHRKANNDTMQPRTNDGKFTYKSVNGQSIDPKYGPSRGKTVNPLLTGGENGIKISDVEREFYNESGAIWSKYKDKWYQKGSEYALMSQGSKHKKGFSTRVSGDAIWNVAKRRYDKVKGEFTGESGVFKEGKKGARTAEEQTAIQKAQQTGEEQAVINPSSGAIQLKPGTPKVAPVQPAPKKPRTQTQVQTQTQPTISSNPTLAAQTTNVSANVSASPVTNPNFRKKSPQPAQTPLKHSPEEIRKLRQSLIQKGINPEKVNAKSDAELDALWDLMVAQ